MTPIQHDLAIRKVAIDTLRPNPGNARTHSRKQVRKIARSMEEFGWTNPVLIDDDHQIVAGHGRVQAARLLGLTEVPTLRLSHLSAAQLRAYMIADNKLALDAGWDVEILAAELGGLIELGLDVELTGFGSGEIEVILSDEAERNGPDLDPEDRIPTAGPEVTRPRDLWQLGPHRLLCGDALEADPYDALLSGERADLVIADPPYNVPVDGHVNGLGRIKHEEFAQASGEMSKAEFTAFLAGFLRQCSDRSRDGAILFAFMDWRHMGEMLGAGEAVGLELKNLVVWNKTNAGMGSFYRSKHELVFVWKSGTAPHTNTFELGQHGRHRSNVWDYPGVNSFGTDRMEDLSSHPTPKSCALVADAIKDCSKRRDLVLDPFSGSGTTLVAAEKTGRQARVIEIAPKYCDVAVRRWQALTGKEAVLAATGQTFEEVEEERCGVRPCVPARPDRSASLNGEARQ